MTDCIFGPVQARNQDFFQGRGGFLEWGHVNKCFMGEKQKKGPAGKNLVFFLQDALKTAF